MQGRAPNKEKRAWKAECIERCLLGLGKGGLETCQRPESGNGECRFNRSRQPFWRRGNALATYFMISVPRPCDTYHVEPEVKSGSLPSIPF